MPALVIKTISTASKDDDPGLDPLQFIGIVLFYWVARNYLNGCYSTPIGISHQRRCATKNKADKKAKLLT